VPSDKTKRTLYATEAVAGTSLGLAAASDRIPEVVNGGVRLHRKANAWHAKTRYEGGLGKTTDGRYLKLHLLSDEKPKKPATQFTAEGKPFTPKYDKVSPRQKAQQRMESEFLTTKHKAEHPNNVPFPEGRWTRDEATGERIKRVPHPKTGKLVRSPAAMGEFRRFAVVGAGVPMGIALGWHGAHKYAGLKDKQAKRLRVKKRLNQDDVDGAIAGGLTGGAVYQAPSFLEWAGRGKQEAQQTPEQTRIVNEWKDKHNIHGKQKGTPGWKKAYRDYPKDMPGAKTRRLQARIYTGKTGMVLTGLAAGAGAAVGVPAVRAINQKIGHKR
jgi:hypothetical protein